ncbi:succinate dehydrogenase cytochrome b558 subunit [Pseudalkalibacillus salsuginis]|uniref:succinate dehydrogenase cytochrome b558 subunit n=1 Tax=Pseudalkalibacillus salsuginis TaxID=2910972 RepID=UPI001F3E1312|nr:succinate dehydrogenase cytochrome b558 subunit [Pseudalkalibacillus salsuginis]MCF6408704.1 succinate dehydrogenase cytochrome b558 subunit [Pseudalkalibacillus salsuginis]
MADTRDFALRRLHSLLGVIPIGLYLIQHLTVNHFATRGRESFDAAAHFMETLPYRYFLEIFIIFLPIIFHAVFGLYITFQARNNVSRYGYFRNWMFLLQRVTGIITLIFISWHVWETRVQAAFGAKVNFTMMEEILDNPFMIGFYVVGVLSTIFHFSNGLWSFLVTWGIVQSPRSQRIATFVTIGVFFAVSIVGMRAIFAFVNPEWFAFATNLPIL